MNAFPRTEQALAEMSANNRMIFGAHSTEHLRVGDGVTIAERDYDPAIDHPMDIDQLSVWGDVTGQQQVPLIVPKKPLNPRVVTHLRERPGGDDYLAIGKSKADLANELTQALYGALPGMTDRILNYEVGKTAGEDFNQDVAVVETDGTPESDAQAIAEICEDGLTFVISDFLKLPLEKHAKSEHGFLGAVAIKVNHPFELTYPANSGSLPLGFDGREVNTNDAKELAHFNGILRGAHDKTVAGLRGAGIAVAHIVMQPGSESDLFDTGVADEQIADAVMAIAQS